MLSTEEREKFKKRTMPVPGGCLFWTGKYCVAGYGMFFMNGKYRLAHRVSLEEKLGRTITDGMWALHACNQKACVNPAHLYEGRAGQNNVDKWRDGVAYKINPRRRKLMLEEIEGGANIPATCKKYGVNRNWYADHKRQVRLGKRDPNAHLK